MQDETNDTDMFCTLAHANAETPVNYNMAEPCKRKIIPGSVALPPF